MNPWLRPSIQQSWWIKRTIKACFAPILFALDFQKDYWETWHKVHTPENPNKEMNTKPKE